VWIEPYPDEAIGLLDGKAGPEASYEQHEAIELAFVATLLLREVLGFVVSDVTAFIVRVTEAPDATDYRRFPEQGMDRARLTGAFGRFGLPARLGIG